MAATKGATTKRRYASMVLKAAMVMKLKLVFG